MNTRRRSLRISLAVGVAANLCGVALVHMSTGRTWLDSFYHVMITVSSIGYGERSQIGPTEQLVNIVIIFVGMTTFAVGFGLLLRSWIEGEFQNAWGLRRMTQDIGRLKQHVIICGFGRIGAMLTQELKRRNTPFVVVDQDADALSEAQREGVLVVQGDATAEEALSAAGILKATTLVSALPSDAENVFIALTARNMNKSLKIIARGEAPETQRKLLQAGADRVILPAAIGAQRIAHMITKPSTIELLDPASDQNVLEVEMEEFRVKPASPLVGKPLNEAISGNCPGLLWVAVKPENGQMVFKPSPDRAVAENDVLIVMGHVEELEKFGRLTSE